MTLRHNRPVFGGGVDRITVTHRELVGRIQNDTPDWTQSKRLDCNPGNYNLFPWLAPIAWSWESYRWRNLKFIFEPRCASTTPGAVQMFFDYDWADVSPTTEQVASSFTSFMESNPWNRATISANQAAMYQSKPMKYVSFQGFYPDSADPTNYSSGHFYVYTVGVPNIALGSLWVEYTVDLIYPSAGNAPELALARGTNAFLDMYNGLVLDVPVTGNIDITEPALLFEGATQAAFTQLANKFPGVTFNPNTGDITIPGPAVFSLSFSHVWDGLTTWVNIPTFADIIGYGSEGLTYLSDSLTPAAFDGDIGRTVSGLFAIQGAFGILRLASGATPWTLNKAGAVSIYNRVTFVLSYMSSLATAGLLLSKQPVLTAYPEGKAFGERKLTEVPRVKSQVARVLTRSEALKSVKEKEGTVSEGMGCKSCVK